MNFKLKKLFLIAFLISIILFIFYRLNSEAKIPVTRKNPLKKPIHVLSVSNKGVLRLENGKSYKLAGILLPSNPLFLDEALRFIKYITKQGVEIRNKEYKGAAFFYCELKIKHGACEISSIHYKKSPLNELLILLGFATFDSNQMLQNQEDRILFRMCEYFAKINTFGIWKETDFNYTCFETDNIRSGSFINIITSFIKFLDRYKFLQFFTEEEKKIAGSFKKEWKALFRMLE